MPSVPVRALLANSADAEPVPAMTKVTLPTNELVGYQPRCIDIEDVINVTPIVRVRGDDKFGGNSPPCP
jgi:hypothetical protein